MTDPIIVNYHDSLLYQSDLKLLDEGQWLNDRLIGFVYEYLEHEVLGQAATEHILLANPSTVQYLKLCGSLEEAKACFLEPLGMHQKEAIFLPLNNNNEKNAAGGSHWSLMLVLSKTARSLVHFDSTGSNEREARTFYDKYRTFFKLDKFVTDRSFPKQSNSSDCGVYLLAGTEIIAQALISSREEANNLEFSRMDSSHIKLYRKKCKDLIESKRKTNI